jgi:hypothetical protein
MTAPLRHRCRFCRTKLVEPTDNPRRGFCCRGCFNSFYRHRCVVCESPIRLKRENQLRLCIDVHCRAEAKRFPEAYRWPDRPRGSQNGEVAQKTPDFIRSKTAIEPPPRWQQVTGPELSPRSIALATIGMQHNPRANPGKRTLIGPKNMPVAGRAALQLIDGS